MKSKQNKFDQIVIIAQAYDDFVDRVNKLDVNNTYSVEDIKMELTLAFKSSTTKYMEKMMNEFKKNLKGKK